MNLVEYSVTPSTNSTKLLGSFEQANVSHKLLRAMKLIDHFCAKLVFISISLTSNQLIYFSNYQQNISQILSIYSPLSVYIQEIIDKNELILHCGTSSSIDNIFNDLNTLLLLLQNTINLLFNQSVASSQNQIQIQNDCNYEYICLNYHDFVKILTQINTILMECHNRVINPDTSGMFEWVDGIIVDALENGHWLLINNVNLCSASVLDRLNSLLETDGTLLLTECGNSRLIKPHSNFRIFYNGSNIW